MKKKPKANPNGANQYLLDPRQKECWDLYVNPKSETFGNATQSAIKVGYEPDYADQITTAEWFKGKIRRLNLLDKAERNLDKIMDLPLKDKANIVLDASKFIAKTLGKDEGYSDRSELTGRDGESLLLTEEQINTLKEKLLNESKRDTTTRKD
jgi:phage terminase small subunit